MPAPDGSFNLTVKTLDGQSFTVRGLRDTYNIDYVKEELREETGIQCQDQTLVMETGDVTEILKDKETLGKYHIDEYSVIYTLSLANLANSLTRNVRNLSRAADDLLEAVAGDDKEAQAMEFEVRMDPKGSNALKDPKSLYYNRAFRKDGLRVSVMVGRDSDPYDRFFDFCGFWYCNCACLPHRPWAERGDPLHYQEYSDSEEDENEKIIGTAEDGKTSENEPLNTSYAMKDTETPVKKVMSSAGIMMSPEDVNKRRNSYEGSDMGLDALDSSNFAERPKPISFKGVSCDMTSVWTGGTVNANLPSATMDGAFEVVVGIWGNCSRMSCCCCCNESSEICCDCLVAETRAVLMRKDRDFDGMGFDDIRPNNLRH